MVFISHATPDDNDFVRWLGTRLVGNGYRVWADIFDLKGGTPFWATIQEAISEGTIKFFFVASKTSVSLERSGVQDELSVAAATRKKIGDPEFIVPLRIDDVSFSDFPIQVHRLNAIDFSRGWGEKLNEVLVLLEEARVPQAETDQSTAFENWRSAVGRVGTEVEFQPEPVMTNLLPISSLPKEMNYFQYSCSKEEMKKVLDGCRSPQNLWGTLILTFSDIAALQLEIPSGITLSPRATVEFSDFLSGKISDPYSPQRQDASNIATSFLRQHLEGYLESRGLIPYETSSGVAHYFPLGLIDGSDWINYTTLDGKKARKKIVGRSEKYSVYWHLAMKMTIVLGSDEVVRLKPYVCFSDDGKTAINDPKRTSGLRKRFCRSWWNPHWRQLLEAFAAFFGDGNDRVTIELGSAGSFSVSAKPIVLKTACRIPSDLALIADALDPPEPDDGLDDLADFDEEDGE